MVKNYFKIVIIGAMFLLPGVANADLILSPGLVGGSGDVQNVLLTGNPGPSPTVTGELNQSGELVDFSSTEDLIIVGGGQARIEASDGSFTDIMFSFNDATLGFSKAQFNIDAATDGEADITLRDQFGTNFGFLVDLDGNGQNFFTAQGILGQVIVKVTIDSSVDMTGINDLQQVRLGPTNIPNPVTTPEPGTVLLLGTGLAGLGLWRWKTKK